MKIINKKITAMNIDDVAQEIKVKSIGPKLNFIW